jgi:WD40 repeat protein
MKLSQCWLKVTVLLVLPLILFLVIRNIRIDQERTLRHPNSVKALAFVANGRQLATSDSSIGNLSLWNVPSRKLIRRKWNNSACVIADSFIQQGKMLAHFRADYEMELWDVQSGRLVRTVNWNNKINPQLEDLRSGVLSPDGKTLATVTWISRNTWSTFAGNKLRLWDVATGKLKHIIEDEAEPNTYGSPVWSLAFSADAKLLATGNAHGVVSLWDTKLGKIRAKLSGHSGMVTVAFSPDGKFLASGSTSNVFGQQADGSIRLWDVQKGTLLRTIVNSGSGVAALVFSPDGKKLVGGTITGSGGVWDVTTGQLLQSLTSHKDSILSLAFTPDARTLATGSQDRTVKLWIIS